jgi:hypothetical protein
MAHVGVQAQLPFSPILPDRDSTPDDGKNIFLAGDAGAVEIDPGSGAIAGVFGGAGYPTKVRRTVFDSGLWLSSWTGNGLCGPDCWSGATTYRVDPQTAAISLKFNATYLIGSSFEGVWVATGQNVELLDPTTGDVLATTPWFTGGEPRVGCGSLWSFNQDSKNSLLFLVGNNTGAATGPARLDMAVDYGPIAVEGQCWAMSGSGGASSGPSKLVWLNPDGSVFDTRQSADSVVVLAGEFWQYRADGTIQRLEASSSVNYGTRFQLPLEPAGGDVGELFSAVGYVWLSEGDQLIAFDIRTGAAASAD